MERNGSAQTSEWVGGHQFPPTKYHPTIQRPSIMFFLATYFWSLKLYDFALQNDIVIKNSSNYYLQGNGLGDSTNRNLIRIIKKTFLSDQRN